ncbi:MAG: TIGR03905 family TSCPD domain-containing protein [Candidatus Limimorpha sp.]
MNHTYYTQGTCSKRIDFDIEEGRLKNVKFHGGCNGNLQGIANLVENMPIDEVIARLDGIQCGLKSTSCCDQLCRAIKETQDR